MTCKGGAMTEEHLKQIKARCEKATEGPWKSDREGISFAGEHARNVNNDFAFIAHARTDIPALIEAYEELAKRYQKLEREIDEMSEFYQRSKG